MARRLAMWISPSQMCCRWWDGQGDRSMTNKESPSSLFMTSKNTSTRSFCMNLFLSNQGRFYTLFIVYTTDLKCSPPFHSGMLGMYDMNSQPKCQSKFKFIFSECQSCPHKRDNTKPLCMIDSFHFRWRRFVCQGLIDEWALSPTVLCAPEICDPPFSVHPKVESNWQSFSIGLI